MQLGAMHNIYYSYFGQSTRMVDSGIFIDKICWFYPNRESTFWTMHAILKLQVPILAMRNNKMGHRINKMWTLINKVGHRNVKLVVTYQQVGFKKQQNGSRVLYLFLPLRQRSTLLQLCKCKTKSGHFMANWVFCKFWFEFQERQKGLGGGGCSNNPSGDCKFASNHSLGVLCKIFITALCFVFLPILLQDYIYWKYSL